MNVGLVLLAAGLSTQCTREHTERVCLEMNHSPLSQFRVSFTRENVHQVGSIFKQNLVVNHKFCFTAFYYSL